MTQRPDVTKPEQEYELTAHWNGADVSVTVRARSRPLIRADKLSELLGSKVQLWLLRDHVKHLVYETN